MLGFLKLLAGIALGQLAQEVLKVYAGYDVYGVDIDQLDIVDAAAPDGSDPFRRAANA